MKRSIVVRLFAVLALITISVLVAGTIPSLVVAQDPTPAPIMLEVSGVNVDLPITTITANVYSLAGTPLTGLTAENFSIRGALADAGASISTVQNVTADDIDFSVLLVIDTSSSMYGYPLDRTKEAARTFIANLRPSDPVAIVTFGSDVHLTQDYTTDRAVLNSAIDALVASGTTALYDAAADSVRFAAHSPTARRIIVFLSDGQEDRGSETATRFGSIDSADQAGIPMYTVGFGSVDREYLGMLAEAAGAQFFFSPNADQVVEIYNDLSAQLRSEYIITLDTPFAADGTEYPFELVVTVPEGFTSVSAGFRVPVPVPFIVLPELPTTPITEPITIAPEIRADDPLVAAAVQFGDDLAQILTEPYTITIDPVDYPPGDLAFTVSAIDEDGETGTLEAAVTIAALPPTITISPDPAEVGALEDSTTFTVEISGQTAPAQVSYQIGDGETVTPPLGAAFEVTIDPSQLTPGTYPLSVSVTNEGGESATVEAAFEIAALPPSITVTGVSEGAQINSITTALIDVRGQVAVSNVSARMESSTQTVDLTALPVDLIMFEIDPLRFSPGAWNFIARAELENGQSREVTIPVIVSALPPQISVTGITNGDTINRDTPVTFEFRSQTTVTHVAVGIDGVEQAHLVESPFEFTIPVLAFPPGDHVMRVIADTSNGQSTTLDVLFTIGLAPAATATQIAGATATAQFGATATAVFEANSTVSAAAAATQTRTAADAQLSVAQTSTQAFILMDATAQAAASTQAARDATSTVYAEATATQAAATQGALDASATFDAGATATLDAQNAIATERAAAAATQAFADAASTNQASTATQDAINLAATSTADSARVATESIVVATSTAETATAVRQAMATGAQGTLMARGATATALEATESVRTEIAIARTATADTILAGTEGARTATGEARTATGAANTAIAATTTSIFAATETHVSQSSVVEEVTMRAQTEVAASATALVVTSTPTSEPTEEVTPEVTEAPAITAQPQGAPTATATQIAIEVEPDQPVINPESLPLVFVGLGIFLILIVVVYLILTSRRSTRR